MRGKEKMNTFEILLEQMGLFVIYLLAGVILIKAKVLSSEMLEAISRFVVKMALPILVFVNITDGVEKETLIHSVLYCLLLPAFLFFMLFCGFGMTKLFHLKGDRAGIYQAMSMFGNVGFMGIPIITSIFPKNGILYISVFTIIDQFMLWTLGVKFTTPQGEGKFNPKKLVNPATVAILLAVFLVLTEIKEPRILDMGLQKIGGTASPLAMIYVGGIFASIHIGKHLKEFALYGIVLTKMILAPILLFVLLGFLSVSSEIQLTMALIAGMPVMTSVVMMANTSGSDGDYAMGGVFITTICSIITLPFICWFLQNVL